MSAWSTPNRHQQEVFRLSKLKGNSQCADCLANPSRWAHFGLGIYLCGSCATVHKRLASGTSVKSFVHGPWTREEASKMLHQGNERSNAFYHRRLIDSPPIDVDPGEHGDLEIYICKKYGYSKNLLHGDTDLTNVVGTQNQGSDRLGGSISRRLTRTRTAGIPF